MLNIIKHPDPILRTKCSLLTPAELEFIKELSKQMFGCVKIHKALGLSAPQVGYTGRLFIFKNFACINPVIENLSIETVQCKERCLSLPYVSRKIKRNKDIKLSFYNLEWQPNSIILHDINSIICQHEMDHLNGKLIID